MSRLFNILKTMAQNIISLNSNLGGLRFAYDTRVVTIPDGTSGTTVTEFDFSSYTGGEMIKYAFTYLGSYYLPYFKPDGTIGTWCYIGTGAKVRIANRIEAWNNYVMFTIIVY